MGDMAVMAMPRDTGVADTGDDLEEAGDAERWGSSFSVIHLS